MKKSILTFIICIIVLLLCFSCGKDDKPTGPTDGGLTEAEKQAIIEAHDSIAVTADSVLFTDDPIEGFKELLPSYQSYANVESAWVTDNALYIRYEKGGVESWIITPNEITPPSSRPPTPKSMPKPTGIKGFEELIGNNKVCFINQMYKDERFQKSTERITYLSDLFEDNGFEVTVKNGEDADLEFFADSLSKFGVIFIHTHGSFSYFGLTTWLLTGEEPSTFDKIFLDVALWRIGKIGISNITEKRNGECVKISYFKISQRFIDSKYSEGDFPYSLVYLTACEGLKSMNHFPKIFSEKGVAVTIGWDEVNNLGTETGKLLFELLLLRCYNLETGFNSLPDEAKHGGRDFPPGECSGGLSIEEGANLTYYPSNGGSVQLCEVPQVVHFADPNLEAVIREKINKPSGDIYSSDVAGIHSLEANSRQIVSLDGIESLVNLTVLYLYDNQISDLAPLSGLTSLTDLELYNNQISNLAPLSGLTSLGVLGLQYNQITYLAPLSGLTSLTWLNLVGNQISDLAPLSGLTSLTYLDLYNNQISNLAPLSGLTSLTGLSLWSNQISNLAPLSGLTSLTKLGLGDNQISNLAPLSGLTSLTLLWLNENQISDLEPLSGLTSLTRLVLYGNQISDLYPLVENEGLGAGDTVNVQENPLSDASISEYIPALIARGVTVWY